VQLGVNRDTFHRELTTIMWVERLAQLLPGENAADVADLCAQLNISDEVESSATGWANNRGQCREPIPPTPYPYLTKHATRLAHSMRF
jgi:hypothetical protein